MSLNAHSPDTSPLKSRTLLARNAADAGAARRRAPAARTERAWTACPSFDVGRPRDFDSNPTSINPQSQSQSESDQGSLRLVGLGCVFPDVLTARPRAIPTRRSRLARASFLAEQGVPQASSSGKRIESSRLKTRSNVFSACTKS